MTKNEKKEGVGGGNAKKEKERKGPPMGAWAKKRRRMNDEGVGGQSRNRDLTETQTE